MVKFLKVDKKLQKELKQTIRKAAKRLKMKSRSWSLFEQFDDYFISFLPEIAFPDGQFLFSTMSWVKPFILDDIFWEVFDMPSNSREPISLRAVGAFKVDGLSLPYFSVKADWTMDDLDMEKVEDLVFESLSRLHEEYSVLISSFVTLSDYYNYAVEHGLHKNDAELTAMLLMIHDEKFQEAKEMAEGLLKVHNRGSFKNGKKWINEYIVDYCKERIGK